MPNIDPSWDKPQPTQYCPNCEELARKLATIEQRLVVAKIVSSRARKCLVDFMEGNLVNDINLINDIDDFLSGKQTGLVTVQWGDLQQETTLIDGMMTYAAELQGTDLPYHNRLKSVLASEEKETK